MREFDNIIFNAIDGSVSANSSAVDSSFVNQVSMQVKVTSTSQGTMKVQASNDTAAMIQANSGAPANWTDVANSSLTLSSATTFLSPPIDLCYGHIRFVYTQTNASSGTITLTIKTNGD